MVLPQGFVKEALPEVHNGPAGGHLGIIKTLRELKVRFWSTKAYHRYHSLSIWAKCKSGPKPKAPLHSIPSRNYLQLFNDLHNRLETAHHDVRLSRQVA